MNTELSKIDPKRRCVPQTQGEHPGEWHEDQVSWIDHRTNRVMVSIRHLETGHVSQVELSDVVFGVDAESFFQARGGADARLNQTEAGSIPQLSTFNSKPITLRPPVGRWDAAIQAGRYWRFWQGQRELVDVFPNDRGLWMVRTEFGEDMELELCAGAQFMRATEVAA